MKASGAGSRLFLLCLLLSSAAFGVACGAAHRKPTLPPPEYEEPPQSALVPVPVPDASTRD
jgi:hypothetical protein